MESVPSMEDTKRLHGAQHISALRYFYEVARTGSIREASDVLHIAPSAISRQIGKLETETGEMLFDRSHEGMRLTPAGQAYLSYVNNVTAAHRQLRSEVDDLRGLKTGHIRIVSIEGLVDPVVSRTIADFHHSYPDVTFSLEIVSANDVIRKLASGAADIGLAFNAPTVSGIDYLLRLADPIVAVISPSSPIATKTSLSLAEVLSEPVAVPVVGFGIRDLLDQACRLDELSLRPTLETNSIDAMRAFARNGTGISVLHRMAVARETVDDLLITRGIKSPPLATGTIDVCAQAGFPLPIAAREFADHLEQELAKRDGV